MNLREFGEDKDATFTQVTLSDCNGHLASLMSIEEDKPMKWNGPLWLRYQIVEEARQLVEVAENGNPKIMREVLKKLTS